MKIVGIVGSPRKQMNTDILVQRVLDGCQAAGALVSKIYLGDLNIQPCKSCKVQDGTGCVFKDDMAEICDLFEKADGLVLGTPVYYNTVSSQMKLMIDRSYCLAKPVALPTGERAYVSSVKKRKKGVVVSVCGSGTNPECVLPVFDIWSPEANLEIVDSLLASRFQLGKPPMDSRDILEEAFGKGEKLVRTIRKMMPVED
ncbi:flavodoxin family protein [Geomonas sp. Red32]|uniref:flavodoxin family protein n=1 Tax=Geomonas sp. Red32 TaxID=2912856 RepID=UPI00202D0A2A|nr:flavodoxin family protein [Geomonas sp. Red32]MCM0080103.1 flavodoxin family protein [Geomonas sp. Red32]